MPTADQLLQQTVQYTAAHNVSVRVRRSPLFAHQLAFCNCLSNISDYILLLTEFTPLLEANECN